MSPWNLRPRHRSNTAWVSLSWKLLSHRPIIAYRATNWQLPKTARQSVIGRSSYPLSINRPVLALPRCPRVLRKRQAEFVAVWVRTYEVGAQLVVHARNGPSSVRVDLAPLLRERSGTSISERGPCSYPNRPLELPAIPGTGTTFEFGPKKVLLE